jgi:hypothetical protein
VSIEVGEPTLTVTAARLAQAEARPRVQMLQNAYSQIRRGARLADMARARSEWGLAILEWIDACVAEAEADDHRDPVMAASRCLRTASPAGHGHGAIDRAWDDYQEIRRASGDVAAISAARATWRTALVDWMQMLDARSAGEDEQHVAQVLARVDERERVNTRNAFPLPPADRVARIIRDSRERERQGSLRRRDSNHRLS